MGRLSDLDRFASLGLSALRLPILWERTAPRGLAHADWAWPDAALGRLRRLGVTPIAGLLHHGSGPRETDLLDPALPERVAGYARGVARRYPWIDQWTPVNEPLSTARFSGLYGHWYPHGRDSLTWARILLNQCRAVAAAMRAVREVIPGARLVQTEDLGKAHSTDTLAYQAAFENERRWLTFDLLCGRVAPGHAMRDYLLGLGIRSDELRAFLDAPCPPDLLGINHYLTSERFLDERLERYPAHLHGGNGRHRYADLEAVRVCLEGTAGPGALLQEAWERYQLPIAITEAHLGCTREEQLRWLAEVWRAAHEVRALGADVRAVTAWALLGAFDWDSLVTREDGHYEPGVFDVRGPSPRPTALAGLLRQMAGGEEPRHPVLDAPGWWHRPERLLYPAVHRAGGATPIALRRHRAAPPLVIVADGWIAELLARGCQRRGLAHQVLGSSSLGRSDTPGLERRLADAAPWAVLHAGTGWWAGAAPAPWTPQAARLAHACAAIGARLLTFSSDAVFPAGAAIPCVEDTPLAPNGIRGQILAADAAKALEALPEALLVRTGGCFGLPRQRDPIAHLLEGLRAGRVVPTADEPALALASVPAVVEASLDLLIDGERGVWHLIHPERCTAPQLVARVAGMLGPTAHPPAPGEMPLDAPHWSLGSVLASSRGDVLSPLDAALDAHLEELGRIEHRRSQAGSTRGG